MIEINLLPEEFKLAMTPPRKWPYAHALLAAASLFVVVTLFLYVDFQISKSKLMKIENEWVLMQPEFKILTQLKAEIEGNVKVEKDFMEKFVTTQRPLASMMMGLSEALPSGGWLNEVKLDRSALAESLLLRGMVVSAGTKTSIEQIEEYLQRLKEKMPDVLLTLTTTRQAVEDVEVTEFIAHLQWPTGTRSQP
ncbi:MAG: hypothetical protein WC352_04380 [Candidatus Omnitrophota bacterium]|jgi:hypothetical protein